jgi:hypothetical protein
MEGGDRTGATLCGREADDEVECEWVEVALANVSSRKCDRDEERWHESRASARARW